MGFRCGAVDFLVPADEPRDWPHIAALYGELARLTDSPVVELNRAVAVAETAGPEAGLRIVDRLALEDCRYLHSTRAERRRAEIGTTSPVITSSPRPAGEAGTSTTRRRRVSPWA